MAPPHGYRQSSVSGSIWSSLGAYGRILKPKKSSKTSRNPKIKTALVGITTTSSRRLDCLTALVRTATSSRRLDCLNGIRIRIRIIRIMRMRMRMRMRMIMRPLVMIAT
jgi:hypothetical protein